MSDPESHAPRRAGAGSAPRQPDPDPEQALCRRLHARGLRFARRPRDLPGRPGIVLPKRRSVVFVPDCFWHGHRCQTALAAARFNAGTWADKIAANREQDRAQREALRAAGWQVETVWECEIDDGPTIDRLARRLLQR